MDARQTTYKTVYLSGSPISLFHPVTERIVWSMELINTLSETVFNKTMLVPVYPSFLRQHISTNEFLESLQPTKNTWAPNSWLYFATLESAVQDLYYKKQAISLNVMSACPAVFTCLASPIIDNGYMNMNQWKIETIQAGYIITAVNTCTYGWRECGWRFCPLPSRTHEITDQINHAAEGLNLLPQNDTHTICIYKHTFNLSISQASTLPSTLLSNPLSWYTPTPLTLPLFNAENCRDFDEFSPEEAKKKAEKKIADKKESGLKHKLFLFNQLPKEKIEKIIIPYIVDKLDKEKKKIC